MHFKLSNEIDVLCMKEAPLEIEAGKISRTNFMREIHSIFAGQYAVLLSGVCNKVSHLLHKQWISTHGARNLS